MTRGAAGTAAERLSDAAAALGKLSRLSIIAFTVTISVEPDIESATISGRNTGPGQAAKKPAAIGIATAL